MVLTTALGKIYEFSAICISTELFWTLRRENCHRQPGGKTQLKNVFVLQEILKTLAPIAPRPVAEYTIMTCFSEH